MVFDINRGDDAVKNITHLFAQASHATSS